MHNKLTEQQREKKVQKITVVDTPVGQRGSPVVVVVIEAVREWRSEKIWRHQDVEWVGAEAHAAEVEAREDMTDARRSRPRGARRKARAAAEEAAEASEERMLDTRNSRTVLPLWLPLPTASCASSC